MTVVALLDAIDTYLEADRVAAKLRVARPLERRLNAALRKTWRYQRDTIRKKLAAYKHEFPAARRTRPLNEAVQPGDLDTITRSLPTDATLVATIETLAGTAFNASAAQTIAELSIGGSFDIPLPDASQYLRQWGAARVTAIDDFTRQRLRHLLVDAVDNNWSYQETARAISSLFDGFAGKAAQTYLRNRAELVAVTEIGDAYEYAGKLVADRVQARGIELDKEWLTAGDERVCPTCEPAGGDGWIAAGDVFSNGLDGPPGHPGCRCALSRRAVEQKRTRR